VVLLVLSAAGWAGWSWLGKVVEQRAQAEASSCHQGEAVLTVAAAPSVAKPLREAADEWRTQRPVVQDHCIVVEVTPTEPDTVLQGLTQGWDEQAHGARPHAWVPDSSLWIDRLRAQNSGMLGSTPVSIASSPVVLAMPESAAQLVMNSNLTQWSDLPEITSAPDGWSRYKQADWGRFTVVLPDLASNPASALAVQSALAGRSQTPDGPVTVDLLGQDESRNTLASLAEAQPKELPATTHDALLELGKHQDVTAAPFDAVPVMEVDLYRRNTGRDGESPAKHTMVGVSLAGATPTADFPFVALNGDETLVRAAQLFREFLQQQEQQQLFAQAGLRVAAVQEYPRPAPGIRWTPTTQPLKPADANTTQQIAAAWASAVGGGQVTTLLVDVSEAMKQDGGDGRSRLDWVKDALRGHVERAVGGSMGLWEFSRDPERLAAATPLRQRGALLSAVDRLEPGRSDRHLHKGLAQAYRAAVQNYDASRPNRVVVITTGQDQGGMALSALKTELNRLNQAEHPIPVDIIAIGAEAEREQLEELAALTHGTLSLVEKGEEIAPALGQVLSSSH